MESLFFSDNRTIRKARNEGIHGESRVYFIPNIELDYNGSESEFANNDLGVTSTIYFWNLLLQMDGRKPNEGGVVVFELSQKKFPVIVHLDLKHDVAPVFSKELERRDDSIIYNADVSLGKVLSNVKETKYVIESEFLITNISSLRWFIETFFNLGGKPFQANSFYMSTEKSIDSDDVKSVIEW